MLLGMLEGRGGGRGMGGGRGGEGEVCPSEERSHCLSLTV